MLAIVGLAHLIVTPITPSAQSVDAILRQAERRAERDRCRTDDDMDIAVCGRSDGERYRLPLPAETRSQDSGPIANEATRGDVQDPYANGCGPFAGRRRCTKREALAHGYGGGRDPITLIGRVATKLVDPDSGAGPPDPR